MLARRNLASSPTTPPVDSRAASVAMGAAAVPGNGSELAHGSGLGVGVAAPATADGDALPSFARSSVGPAFQASPPATNATAMAATVPMTRGRRVSLRIAWLSGCPRRLGEATSCEASPDAATASRQASHEARCSSSHA